MPGAASGIGFCGKNCFLARKKFLLKIFIGVKDCASAITPLKDQGPLGWEGQQGWEGQEGWEGQQGWRFFWKR